MTNAIAGISGGETSARMAYMVRAVLSFQNTSREHSKTYDFIDRLEQDLEREIVRLEFRAPARGEPPIMATFEVVEHRRLCRNGDVFRDMLEMCRAFRDKHNKLNPVDDCGCRNCKSGLPGPIAPWARSRICTAYMKVRTQRKYCASLGWGGPTQYTEYVGLRADEPLRVAKMRGRNAARHTDERAPLADAGLAERDIKAFWAGKRFSLGLAKHLGNCIDCYLKDEADLATAMLDPEGDPDWWVDTEHIYGPMRRGGRPSYAQVYAEAPARMEIRAAIAEGRAYTVDLPARRVRLIVKQEIERAKNGPSPFSCECDAAKADDDELDDQLTLDFPEVA